MKLLVRNKVIDAAHRRRVFDKQEEAGVFDGEAHFLEEKPGTQ